MIETCLPGTECLGVVSPSMHTSADQASLSAFPCTQLHLGIFNFSRVESVSEVDPSLSHPTKVRTPASPSGLDAHLLAGSYYGAPLRCSFLSAMLRQVLLPWLPLHPLSPFALPSSDINRASGFLQCSPSSSWPLLHSQIRWAGWQSFMAFWCARESLKAINPLCLGITGYPCHHLGLYRLGLRWPTH